MIPDDNVQRCKHNPCLNWTNLDSAGYCPFHSTRVVDPAMAAAVPAASCPSGVDSPVTPEDLSSIAALTEEPGALTLSTSQDCEDGNPQPTPIPQPAPGNVVELELDINVPTFEDLSEHDYHAIVGKLVMANMDERDLQNQLDEKCAAYSSLLKRHVALIKVGKEMMDSMLSADELSYFEALEE